MLVMPLSRWPRLRNVTQLARVLVMQVTHEVILAQIGR